MSSTLLARWSWVAGLLGLLCGLAALSLRYVLGELGTAGTLFAVAGGAFLIAWAVLDKENLEAGLSSRAFRYGSGSALLTLIAGLIAAGVVLLTERHDTRWDWTRTGRYSVSAETLAVARALEQDVRILAFFRDKSPEARAFESLVEAYAQATERIEVRIVDPDRHPVLANDNGVTSAYGTVILESGDARQRLETEFGEQAVTNALIRLVSGEAHRICWVTGHVEVDPDDDMSPGGMGLAVLKLEDQNYRFTRMDTLTEGFAPGCEAVVLAAPQRELLPGEREALAAYLAGGGDALLMIEPASVPELVADLRRYGVALGDDLVLDPGRRAQALEVDDAAFLVATPDHFALHPVVQSLQAPVLLGATRSVAAIPDTAGVALHELITAGPASWAETALDLDPAENPNAWQPEAGVERVGEVPVALAVTVLDPSVLGAPEGAPLEAGGRLVVFGTADFARNVLVIRAGNQDLFANAIAWLVDEPEQLEPGPDPEGDALDLDLVRAALVYLVSLFVVPGLALAAAVLTALRRRLL